MWQDRLALSLASILWEQGSSWGMAESPGEWQKRGGSPGKMLASSLALISANQCRGINPPTPLKVLPQGVWIVLLIFDQECFFDQKKSPLCRPKDKGPHSGVNTNDMVTVDEK